MQKLAAPAVKAPLADVLSVQAPLSPDPRIEAKLREHLNGAAWQAAIAERRNSLTRTGYVRISDLLQKQESRCGWAREGMGNTASVGYSEANQISPYQALARWPELSVSVMIATASTVPGSSPNRRL